MNRAAGNHVWPRRDGPRATRLRFIDRLGWLGVVLGALLAVLVSAMPASAATDEPPRIEIGWTKSPPRLDGRLSAGEWDEAARVDGLTQAIPEPGTQASQHTDVYIMTDGVMLYVGARLWDTDPDKIVAQRMLRDGDTLFDDRFGISIDPFLDRQNGYFFQTNSNGVRRDFLIEGSGGDENWDAHWFVKTSVDAQGWTAEFAIPFSSISFDPNADVWGLNLARGIRRDDEIDRWADPVRERFLVAMGRAGYLSGMKGLEQGLGIQFVPAVTVRRLEDHARNQGDTEIEPSADLFYKVTPSLTAALTVNTDFSEAEVDERQVNLTRFGLFFPEKRDFFLQDGLIFKFANLEDNGRPFFSRRIGLGRDGEKRDIVVGGKATGRIGPVKLGLLDVVVDERSRVDQSNLFVARAAANVLGESSVGAIVTHGDPEGDSNNTVVGGDFLYRNTNFLDSKSFDATGWIQASFSDPDSIVLPAPGRPPLVDGNGLAYGLALKYPNDRINWTANYVEIQDEFNPALGFVNRTGIRRYDFSYRYRTRPEAGPFRTIDNLLDGKVITSANSTNTVRSTDFSFTPFELTTPILDSIRIRYLHRYEFVARQFSSLPIYPGEYNFDEGRLQFSTSRNRRVRAEAEVAYGRFYDGTQLKLTVDAEVRPSKYVLLRAEYELNDIKLPGSDLTSSKNGQDRDARIHIVRGRFDLFFTPDISLLTLVQFDNASDSLGFNSRLRWIIEEGREIFLVVNQGVDTEGDLRATTTDVSAKLQFTFRF